MSSRLEKDERTVAVERRSYTLAYWVLTFAVLGDIVYRSLVLKEVGWDLFGIVFLGSLVATFYQLKYRTVTRTCVKMGVVSAAIGLVVAAAIVASRLLK